MLQYTTIFSIFRLLTTFKRNFGFINFFCQHFAKCCNIVFANVGFLLLAAMLTDGAQVRRPALAHVAAQP
jgi:hypothetical protein